jgi:uncharacterized protein (UPF0303 family)
VNTIVKAHIRKNKKSVCKVKQHNRNFVIKFSKHKVFTEKTRKTYAKSGYALPDGSFPIKSKRDLANAIRSVYRAKDVSRAKAHIKKRASKMNLSSKITF